MKTFAIPMTLSMVLLFGPVTSYADENQIPPELTNYIQCITEALQAQAPTLEAGLAKESCSNEGNAARTILPSETVNKIVDQIYTTVSKAITKSSE